MSWHVNSHKPACAPAMLGHCHVLCESLRGCQKNLNVASIHCVSTSDKNLTGCGPDGQRNACRTSFEMRAFVFNIRFHENPRDFGGFLFTYMPHFNHHNPLPFLKVILKKLHLLRKMPLSCRTTGLHSVSCFSVV